MAESSLPKRKSPRLRGYDYAAPNWFFVTICVAGRRPILGSIVGTDMKLSEFGRIVERTWLNLPRFYANVSLENFVVMPNHVHGIVVIGEVRPTPELAQPRRHSLSEVVRGFKSMSAREVNRGAREPRALWQRGYYDHIIRDDADLTRIREYIDNNPVAWANDPENPDRTP
jgi:REP element-mobilizing transposase RayT